MRLQRSLSLGAKLNLSLLAFLLLLAAATSAIIVYGFNRTRDNADARSDEALEQGGSLALRAVAGGAAEQGGLLFEAVAEIGQRASVYMGTRGQEGSEGSPSAVQFATSELGHRYDANPERFADLVVINGVSIEEAPTVDDIAFSSTLDTIAPVLLQGFAGEVGGRNLDPIALAFVSPNGVTRHYPRVGIHDQLPADADFTERVTAVGPDLNPSRRTIWTAPYEDAGGQGLIVTAQSPVYDGPSFRGSIEVDVSMSNVFAQIDGIRPTPRAFAFYIDRAGTLLEGRSFPLLNNEAGTNQELAEVLDAMRSLSPDDSTTTDAKIQLAGEDYYIAYSTVPALGGTFAVAAPASDLTAAAASISSGIDDEGTRTLQVMLAAMAVLFTAGLAGAAILNRNSVVRPINSLVSAARAVGAGNLTARVPVAQAGDELTELGVAFNSMVDQLEESERALEGRVDQRTRELQAVLDTSKALTSTLELQPLLEDILNHLQRLVACDGAAVLLVDGDQLVQLAVRRPPSSETIDPGPFVSSVQSFSTIWKKIELREPVIIDDVRGDSALALAYREQVRVDLELTPVAYVRAWTAVPLVARDRVTGMLAMASEKAGAFAPRDVELAAAVASQAAIAIENARLYEQTRQQSRETEALLRADADLFGSLSLDRVLQSLVDVAVDVLGADKSIVLLHEGDIDQIRASRNYNPSNVTASNQDLAGMPHEEPPPAGEVPQVYVHLSDAPDFIRVGLAREGVVSHVSVPVRDRERMLGVFGVSFVVEHPFSDNEVRLYQALADRAAVAIQNAALYERAQQAGSLEERQRLARELHDSVSQALYGIALGTRTARLRLGDDPQNAAEPIDYVASLAQAGLAEMRALIFELRPESLEQEGLIAAIEKHAASTRARYGLDVRLDLMEEPDCGIATKEAFYRIAQEAIHNVVKHANAQQVDVLLREDGSTLVLSITDDGQGFDTGASFPGHVGLQSMSERSARLGGSFAVEGAAPQGTRVTARLTS